MIKLTARQKQDLATALYFAPSNCIYEDPTDEDIKRYFDYSDKGIGKKDVVSQLAKELQEKAGKSRKYSGLAKIIHGKRNRDLQVASYKEDWGNTLNAWSFTSEPRYIVEWVAEVLSKPAIKDANDEEDL